MVDVDRVDAAVSAWEKAYEDWDQAAMGDAGDDLLELLLLATEGRIVTAEQRREVLASHRLTPGGWECDGPHAVKTSWSDCRALRRVLTEGEHEALMDADDAGIERLTAEYGTRTK